MVEEMVVDDVIAGSMTRAAEAPVRSKDADSSRMGKAAEYLVAATCIIASRAVINVSTAIVDDEGVDLVFHRRDNPSTLAVQVKARFSDSVTLGRGRYMANVRQETLMSRRDFFILFVTIDVPIAGIGTCWLVPSRDFVEKAKRDSFGRYRFSASAKPGSKDKWSSYRLTPAELPGEILRLLHWVDGQRRQMLASIASVPPRTPDL
jgi:hypothetical protein